MSSTKWQNNPSFIIYTEAESMKRLECNLQIAMKDPMNEYKLYPLINRVATDIAISTSCINEQHSHLLEVHNQAFFGTSKADFRLPDCAACFFDFETGVHFPAFWFEVKPLPAHEDWRTPEAEIRAIQEFENIIPQVRSQVEKALRVFPSIDKCYVFIVVGIYWSLLRFEREREEGARQHTESWFEHKPDFPLTNPIPAAQSTTPTRKRRRKDSGEATRPGIYHSTTLDPLSKQSSAPDITFPKEFLPELLYFNEPLIMGTPVDQYNPVFLRAVQQALSEHHCSMQPSWLSSPDDFDNNLAGDLSAGLEKLASAYALPIVDELTKNIMEQEDAEWPTPQNKSDSTYLPGKHQALERSPYPRRLL
ncbi:hypothetical protein D9757_013303 [Collybiopsis confluens]|uniref:Uncharacterized protein n=1 Tax=Collybiopsis confluens TaxID=2823264 RepID=A0A8H5FR82_9AGAR|nr:hypothetical protein D9757_013303 [Collybiopsis confluens]